MYLLNKKQSSDNSIGESVCHISGDDIFDRYPRAKLSNPLKGVEVKRYRLQEKTVNVLSVSNPLITEKTVAKRVAEFVANESQKRSIYDIEIKRNLLPRVGETAALETNFISNKKVRVLERNFSLKSGKMTLKLRGD